VVGLLTVCARRLWSCVGRSRARSRALPLSISSVAGAGSARRGACWAMGLVCRPRLAHPGPS